MNLLLFFLSYNRTYVELKQVMRKRAKSCMWNVIIVLM